MVGLQSGASIYADLGRRVDDAAQDAAVAREQVAALRDREEQLRHDLVHALAELARVRLDELAGNRVAARLDAADHEAKALLDERAGRRRELLAALERSDRELQRLVQQRATRLAERDRRDDEREASIEATMARLAGDDDYAAQRSHTAHLTARAEHAADKAQQAERDRVSKGLPYEQDRLFDYLWRRRYGFPQYRAWPLFRALDGWVAGLCDYDRAHRDYAMLLEIPVRLRAHAERAAGEAAEAAAALQALEQAALAADGEPALRAALEQAQRQLDEADAGIEAAEASRAALVQSLASIDGGEDDTTRRAIAVLQAQLSVEDVETLRRDAEATASTSDDELAARIAAMRAEQVSLAADAAQARKRLDEAQNALGELKALEQRFRRNHFDRSDSRFGAGFDIGELLGGILRGTLSSDGAWGRIRRQQSWRPRIDSGASTAGHVLGGLLRAGISIGSSRSGSGFGTGGGFGGGGFGTGGGFGGGGGGFRTGGGF